MLKKYASFESAQILDLKGAPERVKTASLDKLSDFEDYRTEDGYLYVRLRAISSRVNKNHDGWPSVELAGGQDAWDRVSKTANFSLEADKAAKYGYSTFLGKPNFIDHNNTDPKRSRGVVVDAKFHVEDHKTSKGELDPYYSSPDVDSEHLPPSWVELLVEVDAKSFPKYAKAIIEGSKNPKKGIDGFSMGCDVERSKCSVCSNVATDPSEYCKHVNMKGATFDGIDSRTGRKTGRQVKAYENCYGIKFFEISGVFDPADETALGMEVRSSVIHEGAGDDYYQFKCPNCGGSHTAIEHDSQDLGGEPYEVCHDCHHQWPFSPRDPGSLEPNDIQGLIDTRTQVEGLPETEHPLGIHGKVASTSYFSSKLADNPPPQSDMLHAPDDVNTLRDEKVCPVCGSSMDEEACDICGYVEPPEHFNNPDLMKHQDLNLPEGGQAEVGNPLDALGEADVPPAPPGIPGSPAPVTSDMHWKASVHPRVAGRINQVERPVSPGAGPASDEPVETTIQDERTPITSHRTARNFIAAAGRRKQETTMSNTHTADAASGAPAVAEPDTRADVTGIGGVQDASNEQASKADAQINVEGQGGTGVEGVSAEQENVNVEQGNEHSKNIEAIPTKTFDDGSSQVERQADPVGGEVFPPSDEGVKKSYNAEGFPEEDGGLGGGNATQGTQPADPVGKAEDRVDVLDSTTSPDNNSGPTKTWSGTDGNGVTKQQDPTTSQPSPDTTRGAAVRMVDLFKLADLEVSLGLTEASRKYDRIAELEGESPESIKAQLTYAGRVRTAGLSRQPKVAGTQRLPSMGRAASEVKESSEEEHDDATLDSAIFA